MCSWIALLLQFCQLLSHLQQQINVFLGILGNILLHFLMVLEQPLNIGLELIQRLVFIRLFSRYVLQVLFQPRLHLCKVYIFIVFQNVVNIGQWIYVIQDTLRHLQH